MNKKILSQKLGLLGLKIFTQQPVYLGLIGCANLRLLHKLPTLYVANFKTPLRLLHFFKTSYPQPITNRVQAASSIAVKLSFSTKNTATITTTFNIKIQKQTPKTLYTSLFKNPTPYKLKT
jgi:hypothetical protein